MHKTRFALIIVLVTFIFTISLQFILPKITSSKLLVYDAQGYFQIIPDTKLKVTYHHGCASSDCLFSKVIFNGYTDDKGYIELSNWHLRNLNLCGVGDVVYDCYYFELDGYKDDYFHIERDGKAFMMFFNKL
jgi:hypothetical protein